MKYWEKKRVFNHQQYGLTRNEQSAHKKMSKKATKIYAL